MLRSDIGETFRDPNEFQSVNFIVKGSPIKMKRPPLELENSAGLDFEAI